MLTLRRGMGVLSQNADMLKIGREGVGELNHRANIAVEYLNLSKTTEFVPQSCPNTTKYISYDNKKAYLDDLKLVV